MILSRSQSRVAAAAAKPPRRNHQATLAAVFREEILGTAVRWRYKAQRSSAPQPKYMSYWRKKVARGARSPDAMVAGSTVGGARRPAGTNTDAKLTDGPANAPSVGTVSASDSRSCEGGSASCSTSCCRRRRGCGSR